MMITRRARSERRFVDLCYSLVELSILKDSASLHTIDSRQMADIFVINLILVLIHHGWLSRRAASTWPRLVQPSGPTGAC